MASERVPRKLPQVTRLTVLKVFREILKAGRTDTFTPSRLKDELKISQNRPAHALLKFLRVVDDDGHLVDGVLECQQDPDKFSTLLRERINDGCRKAGYDDLHLWDGDLDAKLLRERLRRYPDFSKNLTERVQAYVIGSLLALREMVENKCSEDWLTKKLVEYDRKRSHEAQAAGNFRRISIGYARVRLEADGRPPDVIEVENGAVFELIAPALCNGEPGFEKYRIRVERLGAMADDVPAN